MLGKIVPAVALACALTPANAELLTHKDLPLAVAKIIAETAIADCKAKGYAVSVVVVDRAGDTL
ncbi:MAG: heme-binding protein, partial [Xanthobacteraceae bacterium]